MLRVVIDSVDCLDEMRRILGVETGIEIAVKAREVAAADLDPKLMAFQKDVAGGP